MTIAQSPVHWKRLLQPVAIPGWLSLGWKLLNALSNIEYLRSHLGPVWQFLTSPAGNILLIVGGLAWLAAVVFWPRTSNDSGKHVASGTMKRGASFYEDDPHYTTLRNYKFRNETVELDGKRFEDCEFENSTILFHGHAPTEMIDPKFRGSLQIASDDPAINNFITVSEVLRSVPHVAKFDCVVVDEHGHKKDQISSWTRVKFQPLPDEVKPNPAAPSPNDSPKQP